MRWIVLLAVCCCLAPVMAAERIVVHDQSGRALADAVVYIDSPGSRIKSPLTGQIAQKDKQFMPTVSVVRVGASVSFPNQDTVRHHVYSFSPAKTFDIRLYSGTPTSPVVFDKPGLVVLGCNIHDWMLAYVKVVDSPWFGKTDAAGELVLAGVPPGEYVLRAWYPGMQREWERKVSFPLARKVVIDLAIAPQAMAAPPEDY